MNKITQLKYIFVTFTGILSVLASGSLVGAHASEVGKPAPAFELPAADAKTHRLADFKGKWVVLEWLNHGCPYVKKHYGSGNMQKLQAEMKSKGVVWLSVVSSAPKQQGHDTPEGHLKTAKEKNSAATAILLDESGKVGKAYGAKTTPHLFVISPDGKLAYAGAMDDKASTDASDIASARNFVREALDAGMAGKPIPVKQTKAYGCSVKYL